MANEEQEKPLRPYEIVMRVKLPNSAAYHSGPSGDTEYADAYRKAVFAAKPEGFEVRWPRENSKWPVDDDGFTWFPIYVSVPARIDPVPKLLERLNTMQRLIEQLKDSVNTVVSDVDCLGRV